MSIFQDEPQPPIMSKPEGMEIESTAHYAANNTNRLQTFEILGKTSITIGRDSNCDISLNSSTISRKHAEIKKTPTGFQIIDNNSNSGIIVHGNRVQKSCDLHNNDEIIIGNAV